MQVINKIKKYGIIKSILLIFSRFFVISIMKFHYLKMDINYLEASEYAQSVNNNVKELTYEDFLLGDRSIFNKRKLETIRTRCKDSSYRAYGIINGNKLIYSTWISLEKLGLPIKTAYTLLPEEGLLEDSYCHSSERGKGLHGKMNFFRLAKLYELGKTKCIAIVLEGNTPAYKVQMKSGFVNLGYFYAGTLFGIPICTLKKNIYDNY